MVEPCPQCLLLQQQVADLQAQVADLQAQLAELTRRLDEAVRAGKRQAAPFRKGPPKAEPKTPGRKAGDAHGTHGHRPPPETPPDECHEALLPASCPHCAGELVETHTDIQHQVDLPRQPIHRQFVIHCGQCRRCHRTVRGRHPLQTSDATGAAASQVGPDAQAAVVLLNKQGGLSHAKVATVLTDLYGIPLTRGAVSHILMRAGQRLQPAYQEILARLPDEDWLSADETGWRIGGYPAWLHVWVGGQATAYTIDPHRSADALERILGPDWSGKLVHDGFASYDRFAEALHQQCVAHVLVRARTLEEQATGRAKVFPRQVIDLFQEALQLRDAFQAGQAKQSDLVAAHERCVNALLDLTERPRANDANDALARHLYAHGEQWFLFLLAPGLPATNWPAEQATRPAVVNRKVWGGNRTAAGAQAQSVLMSVLRTCSQQGHNALAYVSQSLCGFITSLFAPQIPLAATGR
jgi:transposase